MWTDRGMLRATLFSNSHSVSEGIRQRASGVLHRAERAGAASAWPLCAGQGGGLEHLLAANLRWLVRPLAATTGRGLGRPLAARVHRPALLGLFDRCV